MEINKNLSGVGQSLPTDSAQKKDAASDKPVNVAAGALGTASTQPLEKLANLPPVNTGKNILFSAPVLAPGVKEVNTAEVNILAQNVQTADFSTVIKNTMVKEEKLADIRLAMNTGKLSTLEGHLQAFDAFNAAQADNEHIDDQTTVNHLLTIYNAAPDKTAAAATLQQNLTAYLTPKIDTLTAQIASNPAAETPDQAAVDKITAGLTNINLGGTLDITTMLNQLLAVMDDLRRLARTAQMKEREAGLTLALKSAQDTRNVGKEMKKAAWISGGLTIAAGLISIGGSAAVGIKAQRAGTAKELELTKGLGIDEVDKADQPAIAKAIKATISSYQERWGGVVTNSSNMTRAGGDIGAGFRQVQIKAAEAQGRTDDAYAQSASGRADAAEKTAEDLKQRLLATLENILALARIKNEAINSIISKV